MKRRQRVALGFLLGAALLVTANLAWSFVHAETPPALLAPAGESFEGKASFTFAVVGDSRGNNAVFDDILARIKQDGASLIIHTGDIVERCTVRQYEWILHELAEANLTVPFCAVPGNHDETGAGANPYLLYERAFGPRRYWFSRGDTLFVALGSYGSTYRDEDLEWLEKTLARYRSGYTDCIVFAHVPPRDPRTGGQHALPDAARDAMMDVLKKHDVTALFAGHIHSYLEDQIDGIPIYITGGAGAERDEPMSPYHYLLCRIEADGKLDVRKVDVPDLFNTDYLEYAFRVKYPFSGTHIGAAVLLLTGLFLARSSLGRPR